jgi:hypothetical protein
VDVPVVALGRGRHGAFVALVECKTDDVEHLVSHGYCTEMLPGGEARRHLADRAVLSGRIAAREAFRGSLRRGKTTSSWQAMIGMYSCVCMEL